MLLIAVGTQAINTFTVNTTVSTTTSSTGNTGSFMDAVEKVNEKIDGEWKIVFDCEGEIVLNEPIKFSSLIELQLVGNGKITLNPNLKSYPKSFEFYNIGTLSIDDVNFIVSDKAYNQKCDLYANQTKIDHLKGCNFNGINLILTSNVKTISNCNFANSKGLKLGRENWDLTIELVENCTFTNCHRAFDLASEADSYIVKKMTGCNFYSNEESDQNNNVVSNGYFKEVRDCKFYSKNDLREIPFTPLKCDKITNCEFNDCYYAIGVGECETIDSVKFNTCSYAIVETNVGTISNCNFNNCAHGISNSSINGANISQIDYVRNCTFSCYSYCITGEISFKEISNCAFTYTGTMGHSNIRLYYTGTQPLIWKCDFVNTQPFIILENYDGIAPGMRQCRFMAEKDLVEAISGDGISIPTITSVTYKNNKYTISGTAKAGAIIDLYQNNGYRKTTTKYLGKIDAEDDGSFRIQVPDSEVSSPNFIVSATYNDKGTSDLSNTVSYKEVQPELDITGNIKDNTCTESNSQVNITVTGWSTACSASINGKTVKPNKINSNTASFVFNDLEGGKYDFVAVNEEANLKATYEFQLSTIEETDPSKLTISTRRREPKCPGENNGMIMVDFKGNKAETELIFTLKGADLEQSKTSEEEEGTVSFKSLPTGKYEIFAKVKNENCPTSEVKIAEENLPDAKKLELDIDNAIIKNASCTSKKGSIFLPIHNFTQGRNQLIINNVTADGVNHGMYGYQYAEEKKDNAFEQLYYTSESVLDDNNCYDVVYYECQLSPGHYKIEAQQCGDIVFEFDIKDNEPIDLSNISASVEVKRPVCFDKPDGSIWVDFDGNNTGTKVTFTAKGEGYENVTSSANVNGSVSFRHLASGKYEIFASIDDEKCNAPEVKIAEAEIPEALKIKMDIDNAIIKNATCVSKKGSIFLPIYNFTQGENQLIINNVTADGEVHGMYGYQYAKEKKSNALEQLYYTSESVLDDNKCYDVVYYECQLSPGHYKIEAQQCGKTEYIEFDVKSYKPVDLSNVELNLTDSRQTCTGVDNAQVQIGYSNIPEGETIELTIKNDNYSKTYSDIKGNGNLLFYDVPVGEYDVLVKAENDECAEPISLGKFTVNSIKKPRMESAGLSIDEKIVDGQGRKIFHLVISNYLKKNEVTVYHEGEPIRKFVEPVETTDGNPSDKLNFHYTSECPVNNGLFDFVFLDWGNAKSGHYKVEIKDKCDQIFEFEFDIDDCTPLDLSNLDAKIYATRQQCSGIDNGGIQISYSGNVEGQKLKFTIKNGDFEKSYNVEKEALNLLYHDVPAGTYEIFVSPEEAETLSDCPFSTKSLGKVTVAETKKPSMSSPGLVIDESKNYISLLIRNYMNKDIVDVYRDDELVARFNVATEGKNDSRNTNLFYTEDCGKNGDNFDFVFLDLDNAQSGHYLVQVKDQCNQTVEFEFDAKFPTTGVEVTTNDDELVDVYNVLGICMKRGVKRSEALNGLKQGVYIVGNEQVYKSAVK